MIDLSGRKFSIFPDFNAIFMKRKKKKKKKIATYFDEELKIGVVVGCVIIYGVIPILKIILLPSFQWQVC